MSTDRTDPVARTRELLALGVQPSSTLLAELADACEAKDAEIERLRAENLAVLTEYAGLNRHMSSWLASALDDLTNLAARVESARDFTKGALSDTGGEG